MCSFEKKIFVEANDHFGLLSIESSVKNSYFCHGKVTGRVVHVWRQRERDGEKEKKEVSDDKCELIA